MRVYLCDEHEDRMTVEKRSVKNENGWKKRVEWESQQQRQTKQTEKMFAVGNENKGDTKCKGEIYVCMHISKIPPAT